MSPNLAYVCVGVCVSVCVCIDYRMIEVFDMFFGRSARTPTLYTTPSILLIDKAVLLNKHLLQFNALVEFGRGIN